VPQKFGRNFIYKNISEILYQPQVVQKSAEYTMFRTSERDLKLRLNLYLSTMDGRSKECEHLL
jgi:hypothetical protein